MYGRDEESDEDEDVGEGGAERSVVTILIARPRFGTVGWSKLK